MYLFLIVVRIRNCRAPSVLVDARRRALRKPTRAHLTDVVERFTEVVRCIDTSGTSTGQDGSDLRVHAVVMHCNTLYGRSLCRRMQIKLHFQKFVHDHDSLGSTIVHLEAKEG